MRIYTKGQAHHCFNDLTGKRFGQLTCVKYVTKLTRSGHRVNAWECLCDCGNTCFPRPQQLTQCGQTACKPCTDVRRAKASELKDHLSDKHRVLKNYKLGARARNLDFSLTDQEFFDLLQGECHYCGLAPAKKERTGFLRNGIDRVNNEVGYTATNCVPSCEQCNFAKGRSSLAEFTQWIARIAQFQSKKCSETIPRGSTL